MALVRARARAPRAPRAYWCRRPGQLDGATKKFLDHWPDTGTVRRKFLDHWPDTGRTARRLRYSLTARWVAEVMARGAHEQVHGADGVRSPGFRGAGSRDPGSRRDLVVRARGCGCAALRLVSKGL